MIISRRALAKAKLDKLKKGFSVYTETEEVAQHIERALPSLNITVHIDRTPIGCWFIPDERIDESNRNS